jgi:hypothetical protein
VLGFCGWLIGKGAFVVDGDVLLSGNDCVEGKRETVNDSI